MVPPVSCRLVSNLSRHVVSRSIPSISCEGRLCHADKPSSHPCSCSGVFDPHGWYLGQAVSPRTHRWWAPQAWSATGVAVASEDQDGGPVVKRFRIGRSLSPSDHWFVGLLGLHPRVHSVWGRVAGPGQLGRGIRPTLTPILVGQPIACDPSLP